MKKLINAATLFFFVFAAVVLLISFNGPEVANSQENNIIYKYPIEKWWYGFRGYTADDSNVAAAKGCLEKAYIRDMGLDKKNSKRTFKDILDNPTSPENYIGGGYISQGLIKEITLDELAGVKAGGENAVVAIFDGDDPKHYFNMVQAILTKNTYELAGGREGNVTYFFLDTSKYKGAFKVLNKEGLRHYIGFILYFKDKDGQMKTDVFSTLPEDTDELYRMLTDPKFSNPVEWVKTNTDLKNPKLILYRDTMYPTYEIK